MIYIEYAFIKGLCFGFTFHENDEDNSAEFRFFFLIIYLGIIFENGEG